MSLPRQWCVVELHRLFAFENAVDVECRVFGLVAEQPPTDEYLVRCVADGDHAAAEIFHLPRRKNARLCGGYRQEVLPQRNVGEVFDPIDHRPRVKGGTFAIGVSVFMREEIFHLRVTERVVAIGD